jgi:serine/threonine-protein kinase
VELSRLDRNAGTGELVGNYRITGKLGEGGMGAVYAAEHAILGRRAAIKVLRAELSHRQDLVTRFFNEARAATAVKHPGIVEIYDFGYHADGSAFIVMEHLEGESLSARMRRGALDEVRAISMARQVARALGAAHAKGIVHRDLKPDNVFVVPDPDVAEGERTKILDFGIAKLTATDGLASSMTSTGMVMGTPTYMAPEQCKGAGRVDHRADLYALGCILFEMVCGRPPFVAEGAGELMAQHIFGEVPRPSSLRPVSAPLEHALLRALAKEPDERFASADELIAALQPGPSGAYPHVTGAPIAAPTGVLPSANRPTTLSSATGLTQTTAASPRRRGAFLVGGVAVVAIGAAVAFAATRAARSSDVAESPAVAAPAPAPAAPTNARPAAPAPAPVATTPIAPATHPPVPITVHVTSQPPGADVYLMPAGVRIGATPLDHAMPPIDGEVVLIVKKAGYLDRQIAVRADHDGDVDVPLAKQPAERPHPHASGGSGTTSTGSLDPFERSGGTP